MTNAPDLCLALETLAETGLPVADQAIFPGAAMDCLADIGVMRASLPTAFGGLGLGTEPGRGIKTFLMLHSLGRISLPLGRLVEAHVNALRIIARYGNPGQMAAAADGVQSGGVFGLWVTDPPGVAGLTMQQDSASLRLTGGKMFCSGAGHIGWAVVTAFDPACQDQRLLLLRLDGSERISPLPAGLAGMKAAVTGQVDFSGRILPVETMIGQPGDYLREPDFSAGAWRSSAVALGGLFRLTALLRDQLKARGRADDPHQRARFGQVLMAHETGRLWLHRAAVMAENLEAHPDEIVATVGLARLAVERACLDGIELVHRSLGLSAFLSDNPVERLTRDLQTYLRQPAADEVLHNAAGYFLSHALPAAGDRPC
ncbi:acyl-CoA dehydrogenase family protein [Acidisoma cellulosilytica]|uniref:Acyl-CoA dehydrogenase family protein n=1 Tax=Acidisoma cellulosilyticum TaxID=2802395 RepID=A0A963Z7U9_9PROT|nr:acyl-CoA dehydrogenase family protein [Acidisoma cellulosilyticum]MCB8883655.1 acyl-CoA dehydrogenase family protein [Acidisoma cellulosilyticum]